MYPQITQINAENIIISRLWTSAASADIFLMCYMEHSLYLKKPFNDRRQCMKKLALLIIALVLVSGAAIAQTGLKAEVVNGNSIQLTWTAPRGADASTRYNIYRATMPNIAAGDSILLTEATGTEFIDRNLATNTIYYYKVIGAGADSTAYMRNAPEVRAETYTPGVLPAVSVTGVNATTVRKYEKFEVNLALSNVSIHNPFDPNDIDVFAMFTSPEGNTVRINGFYDNYRDADQWRVRFSPAVTGTWHYTVYVRDAAGIGQSSPATFAAVASDHHGWIRPSDANPHYFVHDDGTSYYAVGVYSPWRNDDARFETFAAHDANLFAIWDITYGGFVNGTGLIEQELGRYNQEKVGRIDSLLVILENSDIQLMYAIWPHDLFSETVWAHQWNNNPYSQLIGVDDVYSDPVVWEYQTWKYRYMVARFGHSRSMGIWELINEMNGTDGWAHGRHKDAYDWVMKTDKWFEENDPYNHPTTASFSGGYTEYREPLYIRNDISNIHMYPEQGWPKQYAGDDMRSEMYNYAWAARRFWDNFEKPAIFGEAGADLAYFEPDTPEYHVSLHNCVWACLANGLSGTPVWWMFTELNDQDWNGLQHLAKFTSDIDFANLPYAPVDIIADGADAFGLSAGSSAFGWLRSYAKDNVSGTNLTIPGIEHGSYEVSWFDTWSGEIVSHSILAPHPDGLRIIVPNLSEAHPDIAFTVTKQ